MRSLSRASLTLSLTIRPAMRQYRKAVVMLVSLPIAPTFFAVNVSSKREQSGNSCDSQQGGKDFAGNGFTSSMSWISI